MVVPSSCRIFGTPSPRELVAIHESCRLKGLGAIFGRQCFFGSFPDQWQSLSITFLELFPIALAVRIWGCHMANQYIVFVTDNAAFVRINKRLNTN